MIRDYLALRGESPDLLPVLEEGEDSAVLTLRDQLLALLPSLALKATLDTPPLYHDEIRTLEGEITTDRAGYGILRLPSNYLKLHSLRMNDWKEPLTAVEPPDSLRRHLGAGAPGWMICKENPMVTEASDADGLYLKIYGSDAFDLPFRLLYIPYPECDGETLTISGAAYRKLFTPMESKMK